MKIQRPKILTNSFFLFLVMFFFTSCNAQKRPKMIVEIFTGIEVDEEYNYSDESIFKLGNTVYSLRSKAIYDANGNVQQLEIYKSEGVLKYDRIKLLEDRDLMQYYDFPFHQQYNYLDGVIIKDDNHRINVTSIGEYLISKSGNKVQFYKLK